MNRGPRRALPLGLHLRVLIDVLAGLHHAHELADYDGTALDVVHRDVTPHNVFVTYDGQVKVVDFGIAKALNSSSETRSGVLKGKVAYMAPEQARGELLDGRTDLYAAGIILWELLTGRQLFPQADRGIGNLHPASSPKLVLEPVLEDVGDAHEVNVHLTAVIALDAKIAAERLQWHDSQQARFLLVVQQNQPDGKSPIVYPIDVATAPGSPNPKCAGAK